MNKKLLLLLLSVCTLFFASCDDDDNTVQDITLSESSLFLKNGGNQMDIDSRTVSILTGNGDYELTFTGGSADLVDAKIVDNSIEFKPNKSQGRATFLLQDKLGREKEIAVYVDEKYFLLEVGGYTVEVKAVNSITENLLKEELLADKPFETGYILELVSPNEEDGFSIYENMADAVEGKVKKKGKFALDPHFASMSLTIDEKQDSFVLLGYMTYAIYQYFGIEAKSDDTNTLRYSPPPVERLGYDLTSKYQQRYPEAKIEYARVILSTRPYLYKYLPYN